MYEYVLLQYTPWNVQIMLLCFDSFVSHYEFFTGSYFICIHHDEIIKWKHFPRYRSFVRRVIRSPLDSPHKGQWGGALIFLWSAAEQPVEKSIETPVIWYAIAIIIKSLQCGTGATTDDIWEVFETPIGFWVVSFALRNFQYMGFARVYPQVLLNSKSLILQECVWCTDVLPERQMGERWNHFTVHLFWQMIKYMYQHISYSLIRGGQGGRGQSIYNGCYLVVHYPVKNTW